MVNEVILTSPFNGQNGFTVSNVVGNPDLKPERTTEYEAGLEFMLFRNRVRSLKVATIIV